MENKKIIAVLLTRKNDMFSNFIYVTSGRGYTHASIAVGDTCDCFYSFNLNGFCIEHPDRKRRNRQQASICYKFEVSEPTYEEIKKKVLEFTDKKQDYRYSKVGIFLCMLRVPHKFRKQYFCSQFVAELLHASGEISLKKHSSLYLPNHFVKELECQPCLNQITYNTL